VKWSGYSKADFSTGVEELCGYHVRGSPRAHQLPVGVKGVGKKWKVAKRKVDKSEQVGLGDAECRFRKAAVLLTQPRRQLLP